MKLHRTLNDVPYVFTRNEFGWGVCANDSPTARFSRSYQVYCEPQTGRPLRCSCPHCVRAGAWCKHLKQVELIVAETKEST